MVSFSSCSNDIEATYEFPDVSTGFVVSKERVSVLLGIELWDVKRFAGDLILAEDLAAVGLSWRVTSLYEIKVGIYGGWDFEAQDASYGLTFLVMDF